MDFVLAVQQMMATHLKQAFEQQRKN